MTRILATLCATATLAGCSSVPGRGVRPMKTLATAIAIAAALLLAPVHAKPLREVDANDGAVIQLHAGNGGLCEGGARYAEFVPPPPAPRVRGCWTLHGPFVIIVFLDGDTARVPAQLFKDVKEA